jgi:hypothetical protein
MLRKPVGGMMVGLTLLVGCSQTRHEQALTQSPPPQSITERVNRELEQQVAACASPGPTLTPKSPSPQAQSPTGAHLFPGFWSPPQRQNMSAPPPAEKSGRVPSSVRQTPVTLAGLVGGRPTLPEARAVRVSPGPEQGFQPPPAPPPVRNEPPADVPVPPPPADPPKTAPEVVLLGVGAEPSPQITQTSWERPAGKEQSPASPAIIAPELRNAATSIPSAPPAAHLPRRGYGRAEDYAWLTGELQYLRSKNVWRLRYAPADQEDRFGGTVVLVGNALPADCKSGQIVRVEGQLVNPDTDRPRPPYWVRSIKILTPAPDG